MNWRATNWSIPMGDDSYRGPQSSKAAAVEMWRDALSELPETQWAATLRDANIHDRHDRMEIEETIEYDATDRHYLALHDAFHSVKQEFDY